MRNIQNKAQQLHEWRQSRHSQALIQIEKIFANIHQNGEASWRNSKAASREYGRIILFHTDFHFLVAGMALLVFVTRSFTEPGIDYGPWRPVVVSLAALLAGAIPLIVSMILFPLHLFLRINTWIITALTVILSANIFALIEPAIPNYFYSEGVLRYQDLIYGILVFYALALGYLQLRLNKHYCFHCYVQRHGLRDLISLIPADKRGQIISVSAQDHYVEITTENGKHVNRMSMKEAIAMLPVDEGIQVHRSHWVSINAILSIEENASRCFLTLRNGQQIPVSKTKIPAVSAAINGK